MKAIIIEDEQKSAEKLQSYLKKIDASIEVLAVLQSIKESIKYLSENLEPDLIFLDVQLTDGESFEIFKKVDIKSFIVFITAYDQHTLKAFDLNTVSYLLKPFDQRDVAKALGKFRNFQNKSSINAKKDRFLVRKGNRNYTFSTDQIAYFQKDKVLFLVSNSGEKFLYESSLDKLQQTLSQVDFFRISRNTIVQYQWIESFVSDSSHRYRLRVNIPGEHELIVSQARAADFKRWIEPRA